MTVHVVSTAGGVTVVELERDTGGYVMRVDPVTRQATSERQRFTLDELDRFVPYPPKESRR